MKYSNIKEETLIIISYLIGSSNQKLNSTCNRTCNDNFISNFHLMDFSSISFQAELNDYDGKSNNFYEQIFEHEHIFGEIIKKKKLENV